MATEWFYTTNKTEMGPVSWQELTELVQAGILKPHDLVWSEGMDDWVKAINQEGLFTDADTGEKVKVKKSAYTAPKPPPGRRTKRTDEDEDEDEEDETEARKKARKREEDRARTGVGIKVGLILAGVLVLLLILACGGGTLLVISFWPSQAVGEQDNVRNWTINNLPQNKFDERRPRFPRGRRVIITVTNTLNNPKTDVDLYVFRGTSAVANERAVAADVRTPNIDRNCRVEFTVPANDVYRVRVVNLGPGDAQTCIVNVEER